MLLNSTLTMTRSEEVSVPTRLPPLNEHRMPSEQRVALAKINAYFGAAPAGPFAVWAHQPGVAEGCFQMFLAHRYEEKLERRLFELAVVTVARNWSAGFIWARHAPAAMKLGFSADLIDSIRLGQKPAFTREDDCAAFELIHELTHERQTTQKTYEKAVAALGADRVLALVNAATFYAMASIATVAFETPLSERLGTSVQLPPLPDTPTQALGLAPAGSKSRLPELNDSALSPSQRVEVAKIRALFKQQIPGHFQVWAHQAGVANGAYQLHLTHRYGNVIDRRLIELTAITVARSWSCEYIWLPHAGAAMEHGIGAAIVEAVRIGETPSFAAEDERIAYDVTNELSAMRNIAPATFERAVFTLGEPQLVALVNAVSFYTMICMNVVAFDIPVPDVPRKVSALQAPARDGIRIYNSASGA
jgi:4-carboxymuconolactone decarboxylase